MSRDANKSVQVPLVLDAPTFERIERERGLVKRATYLRELVHRGLEAVAAEVSEK